MLLLEQHDAANADWLVHPEHCPDDVIRDIDPQTGVARGGNCIGYTRRSWSIPSLGASALIAYRATPKAQITNSDPLDVPHGAICYGLHGDYGQPFYQFAHAWTAGTLATAVTTDYGGRGKLAIAPMALPRWTGVQKVTWTAWTPFGMLPVGRTHRQVLTAAKHLSRHQLHVITQVHRGKGTDHQKHVVHVWVTTGIWDE